jgi:carbamoyl-phosphate synthase large subunit
MPSAGRRFLHLKYIKECEGVDRLITTEISDKAPGIFSADACYRVPRATSPDFINAILLICEKENIDAIILMLDLDIDIFSTNRQIFEERNIKLLLSPKSTIDIALDKLKTAETLMNADIPVPDTFKASEWAEKKHLAKFPILIKPRFPSKRAAGGYIIKTLETTEAVEQMLEELGDSAQDYVLQEFLCGTELTVDFFCDKDGKLIAVIPGERLGAMSRAFSQNGGAISEGRVFHSEEIDEMTRKLTETITFFGPSNFQAYRLESGDIKVTEINPRVTGATVMTKASGHDLFQWSVDLLQGKETRKPQNDFKDIQMVSWTHPIFFENSHIIDL